MKHLEEVHSHGHRCCILVTIRECWLLCGRFGSSAMLFYYAINIYIFFPLVDESASHGSLGPLVRERIHSDEMLLFFRSLYIFFPQSLCLRAHGISLQKWKICIFICVSFICNRCCCLAALYVSFFYPCCYSSFNFNLFFSYSGMLGCLRSSIFNNNFLWNILLGTAANAGRITGEWWGGAHGCITNFC